MARLVFPSLFLIWTHISLQIYRPLDRASIGAPHGLGFQGC